MYQPEKKTSNKIWPFVKNNKVIEHDPHKTLRDQYESVFSKPKTEFLVKDPESFFNTEECDYSDNGSLFGIHEVLISEDDTLESLNMIGPNISAGPDGIPGILLKTNAESLA